MNINVKRVGVIVLLFLAITSGVVLLSESNEEEVNKYTTLTSPDDTIYVRPDDVVEIGVKSTFGDYDNTTDAVLSVNGETIERTVNLTDGTGTTTYNWTVPETTEAKATTIRPIGLLSSSESETVYIVPSDRCSNVDFGGSGTKSDPYNITSAEQLDCVGEFNSSAYYEITERIDFEKTEPSYDEYDEYISYDGVEIANTFSGTIDGNRYTIEDISRINGSLISVNNGTIKNLSMNGAVSKNGSIVAGTNNGGIMDVNVSSSDSTFTSMDSENGGIVGVNNGLVADIVVSDGMYRATEGGVVGVNDGYVGSVTIDSVQTIRSTGVVVGVNSGTVSGVSVNGVDSFSSPRGYAGGAIGEATNDSVSENIVVKQVYEESDVSYGGIIGKKAESATVRNVSQNVAIDDFGMFTG